MTVSVVEAFVNALSISVLVAVEATVCLFGVESYLASELNVAFLYDMVAKGFIVLGVAYYAIKLARHIWAVDRALPSQS